MGLFERYLSLWVALCIGAGVALGLALPGLFAAIAAVSYANVNLVVALFIWVMIYPMMVNVDFASLRRRPGHRGGGAGGGGGAGDVVAGGFRQRHAATFSLSLPTTVFARGLRLTAVMAICPAVTSVSTLVRVL